MTRRSIPPRTMRNVWGKGDGSTDPLHAVLDIRGSGLFVGGGACNGRRNRIHSGAGGIAPATNQNTQDASRFLYKPPRKPRAEPIQHTEICYNLKKYDSDVDLRLGITFRGLEFLRQAFDKSTRDYRNVYGADACVYYANIKVGHGKETLLILSTIGDILEIEVASKKMGNDRLFYHEIYLPELAGYDPLSMRTAYESGTVFVNYSKTNPHDGR